MSEDVAIDLTIFCEGCGHDFLATTVKNISYPYRKTVTCPKCNRTAKATWYDDETTKKLTQKELGLLDTSKKTEQNPKMVILEKRLDTIEAKMLAITTEQELLRTKLDLITKDQLQKVNAELSDHNFSINSIHDRVNRIDTQIEHAKKYGKFTPDE